MTRPGRRRRLQTSTLKRGRVVVGADDVSVAKKGRSALAKRSVARFP